MTAQTPVALTHEPALVMGPPAETGVILIEDWGYTGLCARRSMRVKDDSAGSTSEAPSIEVDAPG
ncbi:MAG: hypothetical protein ACK40A_13945, partial [Pannonibacter indicus]